MHVQLNSGSRYLFINEIPSCDKAFYAQKKHEANFTEHFLCSHFTIASIGQLSLTKYGTLLFSL